MSALDKTNPKQADASSSPDHDRALERTTDDAALKPAATPPAAGPQSSGDGSLHLQNAHYGTLDVNGRTSGGDDVGNSANGQTPPPPAFDFDAHPNVSSFKIAGNAQGTVIGTLSTIDPEFTYEVSDNRFEVVDGQLKLKDGISLDHEGEPNVTVTVTSTDASGASLSEDFTIAVANVNEGPSDIGLSNATVAENAAGAVIGTLSTVDADAGDSHIYTVSDARFEVVDGQLKLKDGISLDHEGEPSVGVTVTSTDASGASLSEDFTINVSNVNEGPSDIGLSNTTVAENAAGAVVGTLSTVDVDAGDTHTYTVSDNRFEVVDGQLKLKDGVSLDHEGEPSVGVTVTSTDASGASLSEDFTINVSNVNEGPSDIGLSNATVAENAAGAVIGTLSTVDADAGDTHTYSVSDNRFEVVDGQLKLKDGISLDHEGEPSVSVTVTSTDASGASLSEDFTIAVANVNEGPSDIGLSNATVAENAAGAVIGTLSTVDADAGDSHIYTISDARFEVVDGQLKLKDGISLDHEGEPSVSVTVTSTDAGGAAVSEDFTIAVANVNDGPSDIGLSNTTVAESAAGAVVGTLSTVDADAGDTHSYSVSDNRFEVVDGQLKLKDGIALDHEDEPSVSVTVTSTDAAGASISGDFTINVSNVNEGPSDIGLSNTTVAENAAGAVIGTLSTTDVDAGDSHTYSVSDNRFEVVDGQLKLKSGVSLDHESEPSVSVTVTSTDASGASISEDFTINVSNVNEGPSDIGLSNTTVAENAAGAVIGTLSTTDVDAGDSHTYSVSDNRFEVVDGQLKLKSGVSLDYETEPSVSVTVTTTDSGGASYAETFSISVQNVDEIQYGTNGDDTFTGGSGVDLYDGLNGNDTISGSGGNDQLWGGGGNDTLEGGAGSDTLSGGTGSDTLSYAQSSAGVAVNLATSVVSGGDAQGDTISGFENVTGSAYNDTITGDTNANVISGGAGTDTIDGGSGDDTIQGGAGADTLTGGSGTDMLSYADSSAGVSVNLGTKAVSGGDAQGDTISGFEGVTGSAYNDTIHGSSGNDIINAGAGDDRVYSTGGIDTIDGGAGIDTIDLANFNGLGNMTMDLSQGLVYYSSYPAGADHISNFENASGTTGNDTFYGGATDNTMWGAGGNDTFHFSTGAGHDTVYGGTGSDYIQVDTGGGSGGWLEAVADGSSVVLGAGDWLLQLDTGVDYVLHGSGANFDFGGAHAGSLTAADGSEMQFQELEGVHW